VQFIIAIPFASEFGILERSIAPNALATFLQAHARQLRWLMATDDAFVIAYTTAFAGIAALLWTRSRLLAALGLGFALLTSVSDLIENSLTLALLAVATNSRTPEIAPLVILNIVTQLKSLWILIAATLFAIAIWDQRAT